MKLSTDAHPVTTYVIYNSTKRISLRRILYFSCWNALNVFIKFAFPAI